MPIVEIEESSGNDGTEALIRAPEPFDGDRAKAEVFLQEFDLCWRINRSHPLMKVPCDRVFLALSFMRGNTWNWVAREIAKIDALTSVANPNGPIPYSDERLWVQFQKDFRDAFTDTTRQQDAEAALERIHIQPQESIDQYIARFEDLAEKAGWSQTDRGTKNRFQKGLHRAMQKAIFRKDPIPMTFAGWKEAARKEASRYALMKSEGMLQKKSQRNTAGRRFQHPRAQNRRGKQGNSNKKDPNAVYTGILQVNALSNDYNRSND